MVAHAELMARIRRMMPKRNSRISITAYYTNFVWFRHGLAPSSLVPNRSWFSYLLLWPLSRLFKWAFSFDLDLYLLQRHHLMDRVLESKLKNGVQILELGSGLSARGLRTCHKFPHLNLTYVDADLSSMASLKNRMFFGGPSRDDRLLVMSTDIRREETHEWSIEQLVHRTFDQAKPIVFVMEGVSHYLSPLEFKQLCRRLKQIMTRFPEASFIFDMKPRPSTKEATVLRMFVSLLRRITKSHVDFHYGTKSEARDGLGVAGLDSVDFYSPSTHKDWLPKRIQKKLHRVWIMDASPSVP